MYIVNIPRARDLHELHYVVEGSEDLHLCITICAGDYCINSPAIWLPKGATQQDARRLGTEIIELMNAACKAGYRDAQRTMRECMGVHLEQFR